MTSASIGKVRQSTCTSNDTRLTSRPRGGTGHRRVKLPGVPCKRRFQSPQEPLQLSCRLIQGSEDRGFEILRPRQTYARDDDPSGYSPLDRITSDDTDPNERRSTRGCDEVPMPSDVPYWPFFARS